MSSNILYGVSMHEGVSKVLSLKINNEPVKHTDEELKEENPIPEDKAEDANEIKELEEEIAEKDAQNIDNEETEG